MTEPAGANTEKVITGFPGFKAMVGVAVGFFIPFKADALITAAEYGTPIAAEKGNQKIDDLRQTSAFGGERRGEAAADEIIEDQ